METQTPGTETTPKQTSTAASVVLGFLMMPVVLIGAGLALLSAAAIRWLRMYQENALRKSMKAQGRFVSWANFLRTMHTSGGTCIEERFSPKGPVRFWWTGENVYSESPHKIVDWFTMRKGRQAEPFIHWCRERYTSAEGGKAILIDTWGVGKKEIYTLWSECRSETGAARWVEVAPPEILPGRVGL